MKREWTREMKINVTGTARLAVTAGLCASMVMSALPVQAFAVEPAHAPTHEQETGATVSEYDASLGVRPDVTPIASKVQVATQDDLRAAMENADVAQIELTSDIALKGEWDPLEIEASRALTILGNGHTISGLSVFKNWLGPNGTGVPGDGGSCDYYCGFISNNLGNVTISNLTFANAEVDVKVLSESKNSTGSSCLGVVVGNNMGTLALTDVAVENSVVRGYTKVGALVGFAQGGKVTLSRCAVRNSEIVLEADGTDPEASFAGVVLGYGGKKASIENGIALSGNKTTVADSVKWGTEVLVDECGTRYVLYGGTTKYGLTNETYSVDSSGVSAVALPAAVDGYRYESVGKALDVAKNGDTVELASNAQESITIPAGKVITLDLAGHTLVGADNGQGGIGNTVTNQGTLTITDSSASKTGVIMGGTDAGTGTAGRSGIALVNEGTCVINGGAVKRGDDGTFGNYTVHNKESGTMTISGGAVSNNSSRSSLIRNDGIMEITGGEIEQMKFNAVKNDSGKLAISGGVITSGDQALQNWCDATITGGTLNGGVYTWAMDGAPEGYKFITTITGGVINGDVAAVNYDGSDAVAHVVISGPAQIEGSVLAYDRGSGSMQPGKNGDGLLIEVSNGTFTGKVEPEFIVPGSGLVVGEDGSLSVIEAKLGFASDKVVDGVLTYDVKGGKASAISKADLLKLVSMNVEGYTVSVDDSALPALNKAIGAADTSLSFSFEFRAAKDAVKTRATSDVAPLVLTVKLTDSTVVPAPEPIQKATVTFDTGIGSSFQQVVEVGSKLERPADPTREGWKFVGWFKSKAANGDVSDGWNFDKDVVNADMTLYGGWVKDAEQPPAKPADPAKPGSKDKLAQTGDASMVAMAATSLAGAAAVAAGALKRRR